MATTDRWLRASPFVAVAIAIACSNAVQPSPPQIPPCTPAAVPGLDDAVWGFADLHAHPVSHEAFQPNPILWGDPELGTWGDPNVLEEPLACPVETHIERTTKPFTRTAHSIILPLLESQRNTSHAPIASGDPNAPVEGWPEARDVVHQSMSISSMYRAYAGGLRLLFASVTDSQVLASLLGGPQFADAFVPQPGFDLESARRQLKAIVQMADENSGWMEIAECPDEARRIIKSGKLAVVLSVELDQLTAAEIGSLIEKDNLPVAHVVPVHLVDNANGGTSANNDIFNAATSLLSSVYQNDPLQYIQVEQTDRHEVRLAWPLRLTPSPPAPLFYLFDTIELPWYRSLAYEDLCSCDRDAPPLVRMTGHANARGLTPVGRSEIASLMSRGLLVDVSHMGYKSTNDALDLATPLHYPIIASHGSIGRPGLLIRSERELAPEHAARIAALGGVVGLGSEGEFHSTPELVSRGAPILSFVQGQAVDACLYFDNGIAAPACAGRRRMVVPPPADGSMSDPFVQRLRIEVGATKAPAPQARIDLLVPCAMGIMCADRSEVAVRLTQRFTCNASSCWADIALPTRIPRAASGTKLVQCSEPQNDEPVSFRLSDIGSVTLLAQDDCHSKADEWSVPTVSLHTDTGDIALPLASHTTTAPSLYFKDSRKAIVLYERDDRRWPNDGVRPTDPILRVRMRSSQRSVALPGAGIADVGANVCVALLTGADCESVVAVDGIADGCPKGFFSMNRHGAWAAGTTMDIYVNTPPRTSVCGLALDVATWNIRTVGQWEVDEIRVDRMTDPILEWRDAYKDVMATAFGGQSGFIAFGTDINGFAPQFPLSSVRPTWPATYGSRTCSASSMLGELVVRSDRETRPVRIDQRGLATYGMLADSLAAMVQADPAAAQPVIDSLFLSAERTIRAWEAARAAASGPVTKCGSWP